MKEFNGLHRRARGFRGWRPDTPDVRDRKRAISHNASTPFSAWLPDLETLSPPIRDQGDQNSCTGFCTRSAIQYRRAVLGQSELELSPRFVYYGARLLEDDTSHDAGAELRDAIKTVGKLGIASEALCPYQERVFAERPSARAFKEALTDVVTVYERVAQRRGAIQQVIVDGDPIVFGFSTFENFSDWDDFGDGIMPEPKGELDGGHAAWVIGYDETGIWCGNSWGTDWGVPGPNGERGYFCMPWDMACDNSFADDFWAIVTVT